MGCGPRGRLTGWIVASVCTALAPTAAAEVDWPDGCPPFDDPLPRASRFGPSGDIDNGLGRTRGEVRRSYLRMRKGDDTSPDLAAVTTTAHVHLQHDAGPFIAASLSTIRILTTAEELSTPD